VQAGGKQQVEMACRFSWPLNRRVALSLPTALPWCCCRCVLLHCVGCCLRYRRELRAASGRAASAEVALQQQAAAFEARLTKLQAWYNKQAAVVAQLRRGKAPKDGQVGFTNTNRCAPDKLTSTRCHVHLPCACSPPSPGVYRGFRAPVRWP